MRDKIDFVARGLVRSWSDTLRTRQTNSSDDQMSASSRTLENAFCEQVEKEDALIALLQEAVASPQGNQASQKLTARYEELEAAVKAFKTAFPEIKSIGDSKQSLSWDKLRETVSNLKQYQEEKSSQSVFARPKKSFHRVCDMVNNHSNVLKILPQGDKYTSIVTGSIETITKASVNYMHIGEDFVDALEEIDNIVVYVRDKLKLYSEPFLQDLGIQLCCKVLAFLTFPFRWYSQPSWKRAKNSLNENLSLEYRKHINTIREISHAIQRGAQLCTAREVRGISNSISKLPKLTELFQYWMDVQELHQRENWRRNEEKWELLLRANKEQNEKLLDGTRYLADMSRQLSAMFQQNIGSSIKEILNREAIQFVNDDLSSCKLAEYEPIPQQENTPAPPFIANIATRSTTAPIQTVRKDQIGHASNVLDAYFDYDQILVSSSEYNAFAEIEVVQQLQSWTLQACSSIMALCGPVSLSAFSSSQLITSNYVRAARSAGIPCISYICSLTNEEPPQGRLRETVGLVALVYALIKQIIRHIPLECTRTSPVDFEGLFSQLEGTLLTWSVAMLLLQRLLEIIEPPLLVITIHGIEILEHEATEKYLTEIIEIFKSFANMNTSNKNTSGVVKILLTTSGISHVLSLHLSEEEMFDNNRGEAAHTPGRARKGRQQVGMVLFPEV